MKQILGMIFLQFGNVFIDLFPYFFVLICFLFFACLFALFVLDKFFGLFIIFLFRSLILSIFVMLNYFQNNLRKLKTFSVGCFNLFYFVLSDTGETAFH